MSLNALKAEIAKHYGTPAVVIDLDVVESNIARVQAMCDAAGIANRPHIKTHKIPEIAKMQIAAGAKGITCQKLGEAEIMADAGIDDIFISYNLLGEQKTGRLGRLLARTHVRVAADNPVVVDGLPHAGMSAGRPLEVMVECDTGRKRAGVETPQEAVRKAELNSGRTIQSGSVVNLTSEQWMERWKKGKELPKLPMTEKLGTEK